jgi:hypothetical protein
VGAVATGLKVGWWWYMDEGGREAASSSSMMVVVRNGELAIKAV